MTSKNVRHIILSAAVASTLSTPASAYFLDGSGHFGLRGETQTNPVFQKDRGTYQAIEQSVDINAELRANDKVGFHLRLGLFEDPNNAYLGDKATVKDCPRNEGERKEDCEQRYQDPAEPGYKSYTPQVREAFARYAFDYCILTAGRRSRDQGLGIFLNSGRKPFDKDASIFDGVTCDINAQKQQDLSFTFGFDKLQETGTYVDNPYDYPQKKDSAEYKRRAQKWGSNANSDDLEQIFFGITLDDRRTKNTGSLTKEISIYFSNALNGESKTDLKFLDLYTAFYYGRIAFRNEVLFRLGKSGTPSWTALGGQPTEVADDVVANNVQSIGLAGNFDVTLSRSGSLTGPAEFNEGSLRRHLLSFGYLYAPGDAGGYYTGSNEQYGEGQRDNRVSALPFHRNFKPALLFFNARRRGNEDLVVPGVFDPSRVMNTTMYSLAYRYESTESGTFETKLITGRLLETVPGEIKDYYDKNGNPDKSAPATQRPAGFYGPDLGYELDLTYSYPVRREADLGVGVAAALPGNAWRMSTEEKPALSIGLQTGFAIKF